MGIVESPPEFDVGAGTGSGGRQNRSRGPLILSVDNEGQYALHASPEGGGEASSRSPLAAGEMCAAELD